MANSSHKTLYFSLLLHTCTFVFCLSVAFWFANLGGFDYIFAIGWAVIGCVYFSLGIRDYMNEKIKVAIHDQTHQQPTTEK